MEKQNAKMLEIVRFVFSSILLLSSSYVFADSIEQPAYVSDNVDDYAEHDWAKAYAVVGLGLGVGSAEVIPNEDNIYIDENGLSLGARLAVEKPLINFLSLHGGLDLFNSINGSTLSRAEASWAALLTGGIVLGDVTRRNQLYLSLAYGVGFAVLSDQGVDENGNSICIFCSGREGGSSAGTASRLAIGFTGSRRIRIELSWMRVGGNGNNRDFPNGEEAFLDSVQLSIVSRGDAP